MDGGAWVGVLGAIIGLVGAYLRFYTGWRISEAETRINDRVNTNIEKVRADLGGKIDGLRGDMLARTEQQSEMRDLYKVVANLNARVPKG